MAQVSECFTIGSVVSCVTCLNKELEGEVLAFDQQTKMLILSILCKTDASLWISPRNRSPVSSASSMSGRCGGVLFAKLIQAHRETAVFATVLFRVEWLVSFGLNLPSVRSVKVQFCVHCMCQHAPFLCGHNSFRVNFHIHDRSITN